MPLHVLPCTEADIPLAALIENRAYAANPFTPLLFPGPFGSSALSSRSDEIIASWRSDDSTVWMKVVDPDSSTPIPESGSEDGKGEVKGDEDRKGIAFAKWNVYAEGRKSGGKARQFGEGCNVEACEALFGGLSRMGDRLYGEKKCVYLHMLQVDPEHQRRGAGSLLMEKLKEEAKSRDLPVFLEASPEGHGLYLKHGFKDLELHEVDFAKWGGGMHKSWAMVWGEDDHDESK